MTGNYCKITAPLSQQCEKSRTGIVAYDAKASIMGHRFVLVHIYAAGKRGRRALGRGEFRARMLKISAVRKFLRGAGVILVFSGNRCFLFRSAFSAPPGVVRRWTAPRSVQEVSSTLGL